MSLELQDLLFDIPKLEIEVRPVKRSFQETTRTAIFLNAC